jgi:hypothetical protein
MATDGVSPGSNTPAAAQPNNVPPNSGKVDATQGSGQTDAAQGSDKTGVRPGGISPGYTDVNSVSGWEVADFAKVSTFYNHITDPKMPLAHRIDDRTTLDNLCDHTKYESVVKECRRLKPMLDEKLISQFNNGSITKDDLVDIDPLILPD